MVFREANRRKAEKHERAATRFHEQGDYEQALKHTELALHHGAQAYNNNPGYLAVKQFHLGVILRDMGRYEDALSAFDRGLNHARQLEQSPVVQASLLYNAGVVHGILGRHEQAIKNFLLAEPLYLGDQQDVTAALGNLHYALADAHRNVGAFDLALERVRQAEMMYIKAWGEDNGGLARCYWLAADVYKSRGELTPAKDGYMLAFFNCLRHLEPGHDDTNKLARELAALGEDPLLEARKHFGEKAAAQIQLT